MRKAVVLLSGGLDSAVSLWWAKHRGWSCHAVSFDYGQRHAKELASAKRLAMLAGVPISIVKFRLPWSTSALTNRKTPLPHQPVKKIPSGPIPCTYVPARNTVFLSFGLSLADQIGAETLVIGANAIDYSGYPDCRPRYLSSFARVATLGSRIGNERKKKIHIQAPLLRLTKSEIVRLGRKFKVPLHLTWSCYQGGKIPCGQCDSCQLRAKGFQDVAL